MNRPPDYVFLPTDERYRIEYWWGRRKAARKTEKQHLWGSAYRGANWLDTRGSSVNCRHLDSLQWSDIDFEPTDGDRCKYCSP